MECHYGPFGILYETAESFCQHIVLGSYWQSMFSKFSIALASVRDLTC